jgi:hypothetical protein
LIESCLLRKFAILLTLLIVPDWNAHQMIYIFFSFSFHFSKETKKN